MGFRSGSWAYIFSTEPKRDTVTSCRASISKFDKAIGGYVQEWGGYISFLGTAAASRAARLKQGDRIKLGDVDVTNTYDKENKITYTNFNCYSFETQDEANANGHGGNMAPQNASRPEVDVNYGVDNGEVEAELPF